MDANQKETFVSRKILIFIKYHDVVIITRQVARVILRQATTNRLLRTHNTPGITKRPVAEIRRNKGRKIETASTFIENR